MAWGGKGRSGIGDQYTGGTWEDWEGLAPNGRQYKNQLTQETRDLSGADYWHARKSDNARVLNKALPNHFNPDGTANLGAYVEEKKGRQRKEEPLEYKLFPQQKAVDKIEALIEDVEKKYMAFELTDEQFHEAMDVLDTRMAKAWLTLCKAKGWTEEPEEEKETTQNTGYGVVTAVKNIINSVTSTLFLRGLIK